MTCNPHADINEIRKAAEKVDDYRKKVRSWLHQPQTIHRDLLRHPEFRASFPVTIRYFDFAEWMYRFDKELHRPLDVDIHSYRYQRDTHINDVSALFATFQGSDTGQALRNAIDASGHRIEVFPYWNFDLYCTLPWRPSGLNSTAGPGIGAGNSAIMFSPHMWNRPGKPGTSAKSGPGSQADEVLFHELVHGLRYITGTAVPKPAGSEENEVEEFIAIVVANIYLAEKNTGAKLRRDHHGFAPIAEPRDFFRGLDQQHRQVLRRFADSPQLSDFFNELADIPVWWNPLREMRDVDGH